METRINQKPGRQRTALLIGLLGALLLALLAGSTVLAQNDDDDAADSSETYTVQQGDSWSTVAQQVGITVAELKAANPDAVRSTDWLIVGEELIIPVAPAPQLETYTVKPGESWTIIASALGITPEALKAANPRSLRTNDLLFVGEKLFVPAPEGDAEEEEEAAEEDVAENVAEDVAEDTDADTQAGDEEDAGEEDAASDTDADAAGDPAEDADADADVDDADVDDADVDADTAQETPETAPADADEPEEEIETEPTAVPEEEATADESDESAGDEDADDESAEDDVDANSDADQEAADEEPAEDDADPESGVDTETDEADTEETGAQSGETYAVQPGESWNSIADALGVTAEELQAANPQLIRPGLVLFLGDLLNVPDADAAGDEETDVDDADSAGEADADESDTGEPDSGESDTGESAADAEDAEADGATDGDVALGACPEEFGDFPDAIEELLNQPGADETAAAAFLAACNATLADSQIAADLTGDGLDDLVVAYINPNSDTASLESDLLILTGTEDGYSLDYRANASGEVRILATEDINDDQQTDVVWIDTTCGSSTCFDTVMIYSWDGEDWQPWTDGNIIMAYADIALVDESDEGAGHELVLNGGIYGSVGAGPQRSRTEIWGSIDGAPYSLFQTAFAESNCLYHVILDANQAYLNAADQGLEPAESLYTEAIGNEDLVKCWVRDNEMEELRSFAYYRLATIAGYQGLPEVASDLVGALAAIFPDSVYAEVADVWLAAYEESGDVAQACETVTSYVEDAPEAWEMFSDYGYANPEFTAADVCPVLEIEIPEAAATGNTDNHSDTDSNAEEDAEEDADADTESDEAADEDASAEATGTAEQTETDAATESAAAAATGASLPDECPATIDGFAGDLDAVLNSGADESAVETWLTDCGALDATRGALDYIDLTGDGLEDVVAMPTIISDLGYGPEGAQGALLVYHADEDGGYALSFEPDIYGKPALLADEDVNDDGLTDLAWTIESCSTFCVLEVQMVSWSGSDYVPMIEPGAVIAEGTATFEALASTAPGSGQALMLEGGVSGVAEGGLAVPHTENWQSIDGAPYQRLEWIYDRDVEGNDCAGLRLVEADVAMQAADVLGYEAAAGLYTNSLDNSLTACSLFGTPADTELILLQGLATFRLLQAQALGGDETGAEATLLALQSGQPESDFTAAAQTWYDEFSATGDPADACQAVLSIFKANDDLWRITDEYGYNHPALAAEQLCFQPE